MSETWRLFIALELPGDVLRVIGQLQADLKKTIGLRSARWTRPEGIHLTLKFLGDVGVDQVAALSAALRAVAPGSRPLDLRAQGLGCFPNLERPRVLWLGLAGDLERLRVLQANVERGIEPLGFPGENRPFSPHLTLARTAQGASRAEAAAIGAAAQRLDPGQVASWRATSVSLMRSHLTPQGAIYTQIAEITLGADGQSAG